MIDDMHDCSQILATKQIISCHRSGAAKRRKQPQSIVAADRIELLRTKAERAHPVHSVTDRNIRVIATEQDLRNGNEIPERSDGGPKGRSCDVVVEAP